jgi:NO-binding membrane sensor protein with MHYT domain
MNCDPLNSCRRVLMVGIMGCIRLANGEAEYHKNADGGSVVMGLGITAMHYIAMAGVRFTLSGMPFSMSETVRVDRPSEFAIGTITILILLVALGA